jgi:hypothetical protein
MMAITKHLRQLFALVDASALTTFSRALFPSLMSFFACSMLKSILSRIVPCSTTREDRSLNNTASSLMVLTMLSISVLLYC